MSTHSALWEDGCVGPSEVEAGCHPVASINWDLVGSINLYLCFWPCHISQGYGGDDEDICVLRVDTSSKEENEQEQPGRRWLSLVL